MKHTERLRMTTTEFKVSLALAKVIVLILAIFAYLVRALLKGLFKLKRWLFRLAILVFVVYGLTSFFTNVTYAPYANASEFPVVEKPLTERDLIVNYIHERFGVNANDALQVFKCESGLRPNAIGYNTNGSTDWGVAQINSVHGVDGHYLLDWHTNIDIAYKIFSDQSWQPWSCRHVLNK